MLTEPIDKIRALGYRSDPISPDEQAWAYTTGIIASPLGLLRWLTGDKDGEATQLATTETGHTVKMQNPDRITGCFRTYIRANSDVLITLLKAEMFEGIPFKNSWRAGMMDAWYDGMARSAAISPGAGLPSDEIIYDACDMILAATLAGEVCPFGLTLRSFPDVELRLAKVASDVPSVPHPLIRDLLKADLTATYQAIARHEFNRHGARNLEGLF